MSIFIDIIKSIIKKSFLSFKLFKRLRETYGSKTKQNHQYKDQKLVLLEPLIKDEAYMNILQSLLQVI